MFNIASVCTSSGPHSYILLGGHPGKEIIGPTAPLGPQGSHYVLILTGLGYLKLTDVGATVSGPGDNSVEVSGSSSNWFYKGQGQATISLDNDGNFKISGGANTINGKINQF